LVEGQGGDTLYVGKKLEEPTIAQVEKEEIIKPTKKIKKKKKTKPAVLVDTKAPDTPVVVDAPTKKIEQIEKVREVADKDINVPSPDPIRMDVPKTPELKTPETKTTSIDPPNVELAQVDVPKTKIPNSAKLDVIKVDEAKEIVTKKEKKTKNKAKKLNVNTEIVEEAKSNAKIPVVSKPAKSAAKVAAAAAKSKMENKQALKNIQSDIQASETSNKKYTLADLRYGFNATQVSGDLIEPLNDLATLLKEETGIRIKLIGHTGSIGSDEKNQRLSVARAAAAVDYLIQKGIDPNRLSFDGKGETEILNGCHDGVLCGRAQHQENERIELIVQ